MEDLLARLGLLFPVAIGVVGLTLWAFWERRGRQEALRKVDELREFLRQIDDFYTESRSR